MCKIRRHEAQTHTPAPPPVINETRHPESGAALNRGGDDLAALFLGLVLQLRLDLLDLQGGFVTNLVLNAVKQKFLCLILCQTGNLFQLRQLLLLELVGL